MATAEDRRLSLALLGLAVALLGLPWAAGGQTPGAQAALLLTLAGGLCLAPPVPAEHLVRIGPLLAAGLIGASAVRSLSPDRTIQALLWLAAYLCTGLLARRLGRRSPRAEPLLLAAILGSGVAVVLGGLLPVQQPMGLYAQVLAGPFGYPNAAAGFLVLAVGAGLALFAHRSADRWWRGVLLVLVAIPAWGLVLTRSRGGALAVLGGALVWAALARDRWWPRRRLWCSAALFAALAVLLASAPRWLPLIVRAQSEGFLAALDPSFQWRWHILGWTWQMLRDHPGLGVGPGAFPVALLAYQRLPYISGVNPHNVYLELMAEYGLPAAGLLCLGFFGLLIRLAAVAGRGKTSTPGQAASRPLLATLAAVAIHGGVDLLWSVPAIPVAAAALAGLLAGRLVPAGPPRPRALVGRIVPALCLVLLVGLGLCRYASSRELSAGQKALAGGDGVAARRHLERAIRFNPAGFAAHERLVHAHLAAQEPDRAVAVARRVVRLAPDDPNGRYLAGTARLAAGEFDAAAAEFRSAVERAPATQLRFYAGLVEALSRAGRSAEARWRFVQTREIFPPGRVTAQDARCLAPGDRYLLARLNRIVASLHREAGNRAAAAQAEAEASRLEAPEERGICTDRGHPDRRSPELTLAVFWRVLGESGSASAQAFLLPGSRAGGWPPTSPAKGRWAQITRIAGLTGGEREVAVEHEVAFGEGDAEVRRCALALLRFTPDGWFLVAPPGITRHACWP